MYHKLLRPLREISLQVKIPESDYKRLLDRMRQIARWEGVKTEDKVLRHIMSECN